MLDSLGHVQDPRAAITACRLPVVHFSFTHVPGYLSDPIPILLHVVVEQIEGSCRICIFTDEVSNAISDANSFDDVVLKHGLPHLEFNEPWPLQTVRIPKPWGAEIWYTGIEARGVCRAGEMPLPWLLECLPEHILGSAANSAPLLLKILDPLAHPNLGDLYFELHEKKIEVYIVTHVDRSVWPDGVGKIRYGFDQEKKATFPDDEAFKSAYLEAVRRYQTCRDAIDALLGEIKQQAGYKDEDPVSPEDMSQWLELIPDELAQQELALRGEMEAFTYFRDLKVGDVVRVEPFFPHSLQHGVRVIEFQTASYERHILSFAQKVLTQNHWDTELALEQAMLTAPPEPELPELAGPEGASIEVIADFSAFRAIRITLNDRASYQLEPCDDYRILISVSGDLSVGNTKPGVEEACLIPAGTTSVSLSTRTNAVCIVAEPKRG